MSFLRIPPLAGVGGERLYTSLRPTACGAGEGHEVARGGIPYGVEAIAASI